MLQNKTKISSKLRTRINLNHRAQAQDADTDTLDLYRELDGYVGPPTRGNLNPRGRIGKDVDESDEEGEDESDWDEETTIVAMLQDDSPSEDEREDITALADLLKAPLSAESQKLRQYMKDAIVPAITKVQSIHGVLEEKVDTAFGTGLLTFDEICKRVERISLQDETDLKKQFSAFQETVTKLLVRLEDTLDRRERLWMKLEEGLEECAERAKIALESIPEEVETTITKLEKKGKEMEKKGNSMASKQKMLKGLLEKL
ncbi:hypothetical protein K474DRAFT_414446 [Panus rudis PR-1116 ss-1]|nr:hypothetical protein K474DRAFT_414446 [Panus rudis PR-1116 ss-1]